VPARSGAVWSAFLDPDQVGVDRLEEGLLRSLGELLYLLETTDEAAILEDTVFLRGLPAGQLIEGSR
jgi:hypothetical protein